MGITMFIGSKEGVHNVKDENYSAFYESRESFFFETNIKITNVTR